MASTSERLKEAGWDNETSGRTAYIMEWFPNVHGSVGIVLVYFGDGSHYAAAEWDRNGKIRLGHGGDLVPLTSDNQS